MNVGKSFCAALSVSILVGRGLPLASHADNTRSGPMAACLARTDLADFLAEARAKGWKAPYIYSRWHIQNIASPEKRDEMMGARAFGKQFVVLLDEWAARLRPPAPPNEDFEHATVLLDLADWIGKPKGYGNIALEQRSQDIAAMPIGRLTVNLDFPPEKVKALAARLEAGRLDRSVRLEMLNREAGATIFTPDMASEDLNRTFAGGKILLGLRRNPDRKAADAEIAWARRSALASPLAKLSDLSIFEDDDIGSIGAVFTLSRMWEGKWHEYVGNGSTNVYVLPKLAQWRGVVGYFPNTRDEFRRVWDRYGDEKNRAVYGHAWQAYSRIKDGRFLDNDSILEADEAKKQQFLREYQQRIAPPKP